MAVAVVVSFLIFCLPSVAQLPCRRGLQTRLACVPCDLYFADVVSSARYGVPSSLLLFLRMLLRSALLREAGLPFLISYHRPATLGRLVRSGPSAAPSHLLGLQCRSVKSLHPSIARARLFHHLSVASVRLHSERGRDEWSGGG